MRVNKSFCVHSLWVASIIFFILRIMYVIGIQLSEAMFLLFFKILLMWSAVVLVIELQPQRSNRLEQFQFCDSASRIPFLKQCIFVPGIHLTGKSDISLT